MSQGKLGHVVHHVSAKALAARGDADIDTEAVVAEFEDTQPCQELPPPFTSPAHAI